MITTVLGPCDFCGKPDVDVAPVNTRGVEEFACDGCREGDPPTPMHTPLPWRIGTRAEHRIIAANGNTAASVGCDSEERDRWAANAALIVRVVNSHADMRAALIEQLELVESVWGEHFVTADETEMGDCAELCPASDCQNFGCITGKIQRARAAIAKAEGR